MQQSRSRKTRKKSSTWSRHGRRYMVGLNVLFNRWRRKRRLALETVEIERGKNWSAK